MMKWRQLHFAPVMRVGAMADEQLNHGRVAGKEYCSLPDAVRQIQAAAGVDEELCTSNVRVFGGCMQASAALSFFRIGIGFPPRDRRDVSLFLRRIVVDAPSSRAGSKAFLAWACLELWCRPWLQWHSL